MAMTIKDFRRIALSFEGAKRVRTWRSGFRVAQDFCTLAHGKKDTEFDAESGAAGNVRGRVAGDFHSGCRRWGRNGATMWFWRR